MALPFPWRVDRPQPQQPMPIESMDEDLPTWVEKLDRASVRAAQVMIFGFLPVAFSLWMGWL
jgi:hypothetical protein